MDDVVAVVTDLFFQSRIASAAAKAQRSVRFLRDVGECASVADFTLALVDLDARFDVLEAVRLLRIVDGATIVCFGPHVDTPRRKEARNAGADRVLAKSKFVTDLPGLMAGGPFDGE